MNNKSTITNLFSQQVTSTPQNIAVVFEGKAITYKELDEKSNQLAHYLQANGIVQNNLIPICTSRSVEMIIGLLGILKAGAVYVPLDPEYPKERIDYLIKDTKATLVITNNSSNALVKTGNDEITVTNIESDWADIAKYPTEQPVVKTDELQLTYILFTSGSTGTPKGVAMGEAALLNLLSWQQNNSIATTGINTLQFAPLIFDVSFQEIFSTLTTGGTLVLIDNNLRVDPNKLLAYIEQYNVNRIFFPFVVLQYLTEAADAEKQFPACLKEVITAGEQLKITPQVVRFFSALPNCTLFNQYGPTETHVVTQLILTGDPSSWPALPSIGIPVDETEILILDEELKSLPAGETGELCVSGTSLAQGYLNRPDMTAEKFIDWTDAQNNTKRIYRTGDLARYLPDGNIEYLGRRDTQVKIRGNRVELGEIEVKLNEEDDIKQAVVIAREDIIGQKRLVAYLVAATDKPDTDAIKKSMEQQLPDFMLPSVYVWLTELPKTTSGKVDRKALPKPDMNRPDLDVPYRAPVSLTEKNITTVFKDLLLLNKVGIDDNFFQVGGNSLLALKAVASLKQQFNYKVPITKLYQYPTVNGIANFLDKKSFTLNTPRKKSAASTGSTDIAVIGMAGRFPGATTINALLEILTQGKETTSFFTDEELDSTIPANIKNDPTYVKARGILTDTEYFDPAFFGINPKLAELMDPQQRMFLEIAWEVLEQTGHLPSKYPKKIGVFAGSGTNTYYENNVLAHPDLVNNQGKLQVLSVNEKDYIASRTAYHLNLKGPGISINAACSTSLLAVAEAVNSLRAGQCEAAIAGGACITTPIKSGHLYQEGSMLSADGHCKPFDDDATGTVFSDGAGVVLLKTLDNARRDGDMIYGVIKGIGLNNDGYGKGSFTAPSSEGQADAISAAIADAEVNPADITYVEAHGTGTPIGDPIEFDGLVAAFDQQNNNQYCAIGSIKSNFGHLTHAAGVAGLIKACLSLHNKKLFPSIGYKTPNKHIDFANSPFYVNDKLKDWDTDKKRIAGVSSFGVGGTNVHVVLEEYENPKPVSSQGRPFELITWSANTETSRDNYATALGSYVKDNAAINIADLAFSLQKTRDEFSFRRFAVANAAQSLTDVLFAAPVASNINNVKELPSEVVFTFPGQGAQYLNMGAHFYKHEPVYKNAVDECADILTQYIDADIRQIIFPAETTDEANDKLRDTRYTQPALFVTEYALANLWMSWGITPTLFCGHSIGEYVAAHLAGVFSLADGLKLIAIRGKMVSELPKGSMLSVRDEESIVAALLPQNLSIAAVNSPKLCVVAGPDEAIADFSKLLDGKEIPNKLLFTSHAFHSAMMDPILNGFKQVVSEVSFSAPQVPIISTVTGNVLSDAEAVDPDYWVHHLRNTVQFSKAIQTVLGYDNPVFLEVGPGAVTATLVKQIAAYNKLPDTKTIATLNIKEDDYAAVLTALGQLWSYGLEPNWANFYNGQQRLFINLPSYQFDRKKYWVEPNLNLSNPQVQSAVNASVLVNGAIALNTQLPPTITANITENVAMRKSNLTSKVKQVLEDASGIEMANVELNANFMEIGLDSLLLTQIAISLKRAFNLPITFRKLNEEYPTIETLVDYIDQNIPQDEQPIVNTVAQPATYTNTVANSLPAGDGSMMTLIVQQLDLLSKQVMLMQGGAPVAAPAFTAKNTTAPIAAKAQTAELSLSKEDKEEIKKPFGATPKIDRQVSALSQKQVDFIKDLTISYNKKTAKSKEYTDKSRAYMADPRVVSGFKPTTKELIYPIVINKSVGSTLWDIDGNEYLDALNGFGSNMIGYQQDDVKAAMHEQIEKGYEVGPQHELAAYVSKLVCEFTGSDRAALCSTGSEAVLGCIRVARTVTGRSLIVAFTGSYHGINDEVLVRGTKILKSFPAAAGIMPEAVQNILVLDYGTEESLAIIKQRADEIAAVLVEPIQSRRPEFVPIEFLKKVREVTEQIGAALIFDEVISGFRFHPGGAQALMGIRADIASYGKVVGAGVPIGVIAGKKEFMDALDGGTWNYGDDSYPEIGVTYFAGTFVRHPLALASAKASLEYMKARGPELQLELNAKGNYLAKAINEAFESRQLPIYVANYGSLWKVKYHEELPYSELMFVLLRQKGIHILDGFPCFITKAMTYQDLDRIITCFNESIDTMIDVGFFPSINSSNPAYNPKAIVIDINNPPVKGAKLGKDKAGNPAWFIQHPTETGKYLQVERN